MKLAILNEFGTDDIPAVLSEGFEAKKSDYFVSHKEAFELVKGLEEKKTYNVTARLRQYPAKGLHEIDFLKICLAVSLMTEQPDLFEMNVTYAGVQYHWENFGWAIHLAFCGLYLIYIALVLVVNILIHDSYQMSAGLHVAIILTVLLSLLFLVLQCFQIIMNSGNYYVLQYCMDFVAGFIAYLLTLVGCAVRLSYGIETKASADVTAVATLFVFLKGLDLLRPFEMTGPTIRTVYAILYQILPLIGILLVINIGFSQAFYLVSYLSPHLDSHGAGASILFTYVYMTGQPNWSDMFLTTTPTLALIFMCVFIGLTTILIINLIIAKMNNVYSTILSDAEGEWKREQCKLIIGYSFFRKYFHRREEGEHLTILMREEYEAERKEEYLLKHPTVVMRRDIEKIVNPIV